MDVSENSNSATACASYDLKIGSADLTLAQRCTCEIYTNIPGKFFFPIRSRLDIRENSKAPTFPYEIRKKKKNVVPEQPNKVNIGGDDAEDTRETSI